MHVPVQFTMHARCGCCNKLEKESDLEGNDCRSKDAELGLIGDVADQRTWSCPKKGCAATATQRAVMVKHLGGHAEYDGAEVRIGTAKFQTKAETAKVVQTSGPYKNHKDPVKRKKSADTASKPRKNAKHDTATDKMLELFQKQTDSFDQMQNSMAKSIQKQIDSFDQTSLEFGVHGSVAHCTCTDTRSFFTCAYSHPLTWV